MFEDQQQLVEKLTQSDQHFSSLYQRHQDLKQRVHGASTGAHPMDSFSLERLKKEKLHLKDQMAVIIQKYQEKQ